MPSSVWAGWIHAWHPLAWWWGVHSPRPPSGLSLHASCSAVAHIFHQRRWRLASQKPHLLTDGWPRGKGLSPMLPAKLLDTHPISVRMGSAAGNTEPHADLLPGGGWWVTLQLHPAGQCSFPSSDLCGFRLRPLNNWNCFLDRQEWANWVFIFFFFQLPQALGVMLT